MPDSSKITPKKSLTKYIQKQCEEAKLPLDDYIIRKIKVLIWHELLTSEQHYPADARMIAVKEHINIVDCYIFVHLREIQYNIHLANVWHTDGLGLIEKQPDYERTYERKPILDLLEARTKFAVVEGRLPTRYKMLKALEEAYDFFNDPTSQYVLRDNVKIGYLEAIEQALSLLVTPFFPSSYDVRGDLKGFYNLFHTVNDARINIVKESFEHDSVYQSMMRHKPK